MNLERVAECKPEDASGITMQANPVHVSILLASSWYSSHSYCVLQTRISFKLKDVSLVCLSRDTIVSASAINYLYITMTVSIYGIRVSV
ncbi:uncharacterized protein CC84DRAFT_794927 [Paraphaeosphaeria sporulosa]|uniref:Uncharacterized protein n=1 Tax=Paraphaeosphaeria sporulosa TaxID=1460663 RepID=A0A177CBF1_9PLEO|nr:uncharacterized protein CC84DRAFT_794927 [Paraphaeosphaeria sporulosa]OAG04521.1 hypothetical protein CC84DRAFT_794927 [Paraphaeosphaeria sporulosa]